MSNAALRTGSPWFRAARCASVIVTVIAAVIVQAPEFHLYIGALNPGIATISIAAVILATDAK
jgi:hypothetical protein